MQTFLESKPQTESIWRSVILFGRNVASYKFALGKSLLELADKETNFVYMEDLQGSISIKTDILENVELSTFFQIIN